MTYDKKMAVRIAYSEEWPNFGRPEYIDMLDELATVAYGKETIEGDLSSSLICQQLVEEMVKILIKDSHFLIEISLWGVSEIHHKKPEGKMFGRLVDELKCAVSFQEKHEFIRLCNIINKERIALVHGLTMDPDVAGIRKRASIINESYRAAKVLFWSAHRWFISCFESERSEMLSVNPLPPREDS